MKLGVSNSGQLSDRIRDLDARTNIEEMVDDVSPFLCYPANEKKNRLFLPIVEQSN
ncbi:hypothetical protein [Pararhodonellum marinum]|uniref:hypothetical protein n=1 Tax=Pararhodonellum marinum TaxID=2755358 RepID=UPI00188F193C|nr:hypothetical protein [Pararhodonellum marinum]